MKAYEARFENDKGDILIITVIAIDIKRASVLATAYEEQAGQGYELAAVERATRVVLIEDWPDDKETA